MSWSITPAPEFVRNAAEWIELLSLDDSPEPIHVPLQDLVALDIALSDLAHAYPRPGEVVELMHFGGLTVDETAAALGISRRTALRDWRFARTWLLRALASDASDRRRLARDGPHSVSSAALE